MAKELSGASVKVTKSHIRLSDFISQHKFDSETQINIRETFKQTGINHFLSLYSNSNFCSTANFFPSKKVKQSGHKLILNAEQQNNL